MLAVAYVGFEGFNVLSALRANLESHFCMQI